MYASGASLNEQPHRLSVRDDLIVRVGIEKRSENEGQDYSDDNIFV